MSNYINLPAKASPRWKSPVTNAAALPLLGNTNGDVRITLNDDSIYVWNGTSWVQASTPAATSAITALIGDVSATGPGAVSATLATVNGSPGTFGSATQVAQVSVNAKGLSTTVANVAIQITESQVTNLVSDLAGKQATGNYITALTGDGTASGPGSAALTFATVNSNVGTFGSASSVMQATVNAKGLVTAASSVAVQITESQVTNLVSDLAGKQATGNYITALTGDITASGPGSSASTLATVNGNVGSFGSASSSLSVTANAKGLITAISSQSIQITESQVTNLISDLAAKQATITIGALDAQAENANGLALVSNVLSSQSADATHPGMVNITTQTFAGAKTFANVIKLPDGALSSGNLALGFTNSLTTGIYSSVANTLDFVANGVMAFSITASGYNIARIGLAGSSTASGNLQLYSTSNATKGSIVFGAAGTSFYNEINDSLVIGTRFTSGVFALTDGATPALDASKGNTFTLTSTQNPTIAVPTNAIDGQKMLIVFTASGGARTLALNTGAGGFHFGSDITALSQTASGKIDYIGCIYNSTSSLWNVVAYTKGF